MQAYEYVINHLYFTAASVVHTLILTFASRDQSQGCPTLLGMAKCFFLEILCHADAMPKF